MAVKPEPSKAPEKAPEKVSIIDKLLDTKAAKAEVTRLRAAFNGPIPDGALMAVVDGYLMGRAREFFLKLCRAWENDLP